VGAVARLPSAALSTRRGGDVPTDPRHADDLTPLQPVVLLDVGLVQASGMSTERIGERAWVRFESGYSPLLWQGVRWLQQQALRRFNPQF
jgi:putative peptide zinc metalloprotease protein